MTKAAGRAGFRVSPRLFTFFRLYCATFLSKQQVKEIHLTGTPYYQHTYRTSPYSLLQTQVQWSPLERFALMSTPQSPPARPYRDFLTPFLHRRFTSAALLTLGVCYVEAVLMGQWDLFWSWFPFGKAGLRTLMLFISILAVYILRVAQLHIGARTTVSPLQTFRQQVFSFNTAQTLAWYSFSAWFFCEVYIWSAGVDAKLAMVDPGK